MNRLSGAKTATSRKVRCRAAMLIMTMLVGLAGSTLAAFDAEARQRRTTRPSAKSVPKAYMMHHGYEHWVRRAPQRSAPYIYNPNTEAAMRIQDSHNGSVGP